MVSSVTRDPWGNRVLLAGGDPLDLGYPGQWRDPASGLFQNHHRDYDPMTGRYIEADPLGLGGGSNLYAYVGGDPINAVDPDGRCIGYYAIGCAMAVGGLIGGLIDLDWQLLHNGGQIDYIDWSSVGWGAGIGTVTGGLGQVAGPFFRGALGRIGGRAGGGFGRGAGSAGARGGTGAGAGGSGAAGSTDSPIIWNNGWSTANGKFASPLGPGRPGGSAEAAVWDAIAAKPGWSVRTGNVAVRNASGQLRYYDGVAITPTRRVIGLEIKSGSGYRRAAQRLFDTVLNSSTSNVAIGVGQSTGITVRRSILIVTP